MFKAIGSTGSWKKSRRDDVYKVLKNIFNFVLSELEIVELSVEVILTELYYPY